MDMFPKLREQPPPPFYMYIIQTDLKKGWKLHNSENGFKFCWLFLVKVTPVLISDKLRSIIYPFCFIVNR